MKITDTMFSHRCRDSHQLAKAPVFQRKKSTTQINKVKF